MKNTATDEKQKDEKVKKIIIQAWRKTHDNSSNSCRRVRYPSLAAFQTVKPQAVPEAHG
jgi:hypothetical protein